MCGIAGLSLVHAQDWAERRVEEMTASLAHRGPDSAGHLSTPDKSIWLGFRRLAIRDLDPRANQPMLSVSRRTAMVFNGEIYNVEELAAQFLPDYQRRTTGDSEVFLEAFERHGPRIFAECNGMFAAGFVDMESGRLSLVRDRMGKKPLFLYQGQDFLAFGSELRALRSFGLDPDPEQLPYFFHLGYFPAPRTFFKRTTQVQPGEVIEVSRGRIISRRQFHRFTDWAWGTEPSVDLDALDRLLADAVQRRTLSDVPVGAFLSGGIDSSIVAACLKATGHSRLPMFTVAIEGTSEAPHATAVANYLDVSHAVLPFDSSQLMDLMPAFHQSYEQPTLDSSGLPSILLCQAVRQHVTVALSGDGGDEFFGGYQRYDWLRQALQAQRVPSVARRLLGSLAASVDRRRGFRIQRLLETHDDAGMYAAIIDPWTSSSPIPLSEELRRFSQAPAQLVRDLFAQTSGDPLSKAACFDATYYIPDDLQVKVDRASMRVALEVRSPLLDYRVARIGAELSPAVKYRSGLKTVLRDVLERHLPRRLFERPKQGFGVPLRSWLRGPLRGVVHDAFNRRAVRECGWLDGAKIDMIESRFLAGEDELATPVWSLFVLTQQL